MPVTSLPAAGAGCDGLERERSTGERVDSHCVDCIEVRDVCFGYNGNKVLENVTFSVRKGDYLGIIGPNGGGKTTLIKLMLGLIAPSSGEIVLFGRKSTSFTDRFLIGYVPQRVSQGEFYFPATVEEIVRSGRTARLGLGRRFTGKDAIAVENALEAAGVADYRKRLVGKLSGGERQRVFIARALAGEPQVLVLDEPVVGVDIASQERFYAFLGQLNSAGGITVIFVSHDVGAIAREVQTILCLNKHLCCHGLPEDLIKEEYLGSLYGTNVSSLLHRH